jgi:predicted permease
MDSPRELLRRMRMLVHRDRFQSELDEEMRLHLELREQQQREAGLPATSAHREAQLRFGNPVVIRERSLTAWGWSWLESFAQDVGYGIRSLFRSPALTLVALLSLALGIGANTAIFSFMDAIMLRSLPVKDPGQLVLLGKGTWNGISDDFAATELYSYPFFRQMQQRNSVFSDTAAVFSITNRVYGFLDHRDIAEPIYVKLVSGSWFPMLGVEPQLGRTLNESDDSSEGDHPVVVLSNTYWKRALSSDPDVLHRTLKLGETTYTIVGVAPPDFFGTTVGEAPDMWAPLSMIKAVPPGFGGYKDNFSESLYVMGRLKPGVSPDQAATNVNLIYQQILRGFPDSKLNQENLGKLARAVVPLTPMSTGLSGLRRQFSQPLRILMTVVALVLLIACANIANLLLARSTVRARELAVRQALGATRFRIVRQLLTESLVLALAGGALGIAFAAGAIRLLLHMVSDAFSGSAHLDVSLNLRLLAFSFVVTIFTAILFGTLPALRTTRPDLVNSLRDGRGASSGTARNPLAKALVVSQVALSLVLLIGAVLFLRSLVNLNNVDPGFNKDSVLRLQIDSPSTGYKADDPRMAALYQQIEQRVAALPGVKAASFSSFVFDEGSWNGYILVPGMPVNHDLDVKHNIIGNGYFDTMQIPLVAGRHFDPQDTATSQHVAIISEHVAKTLFPAGVSPIGRSYYIGSEQPGNLVEVIGIAKDVKFQNLQEDIVDLDYVPYTQHPTGYGDFEVRYTGSFDTISTAVQQTIHSIHRTLPIMNVMTMEQQISRSIVEQRLVAQLSAFFGALAVFLSAIGIYGLMSYTVSRRTNEIGIRMALGAARSNVRWMVMREILLLVGTGLAIGVPITLIAYRAVASMLFGMKGANPGILALATGALLAVAVLAGYLPARRASQVSPMDALRCE